MKTLGPSAFVQRKIWFICDSFIHSVYGFFDIYEFSFLARQQRTCSLPHSAMPMSPASPAPPIYASLDELVNVLRAHLTDAPASARSKEFIARVTSLIEAHRFNADEVNVCLCVCLYVCVYKYVCVCDA